MFRQSKDGGYEDVAIILAALLIFSTIFLTENRAIKARENVPLILEESDPITETSFTLPETPDIVSDTLVEVQSTVPRSTIADIASSTTRSVNPTTIPGTTIPAEPENVNPEKVLDDLQIDACAAADESGACRKLNGLGIVEIEDCCKYLGRCCL
jgi:hypothetical protein